MKLAIEFFGGYLFDAKVSTDMRVKQARRWLLRHPVYSVLLTLLSFALIYLPPYLADTWSLVSDRPLIPYIEEKVGIQAPSFSVSWVTVPVGLTAVLVIIGLLATGRREENTRAEHERIVKGLNDHIEELNIKVSELGEFKSQNQWLHTLAVNQRNSINGYVKVKTCEISGHDFLQELYVDFKFTILNVSVHTISIEDSIEGDIKLDTRLLSKGVKMKANDAKYCQNNEIKDFTVRQWLDRDEIADILRATDDACKFRLHSLDITVKGEDFGELKGMPRRLDVYGLSLSSKPLRELSQKLGIEILKAYFKGYWIPSKAEQVGSQINVRVGIENPRAVDVEIREFRLTIKAGGKEYTQSAEAGEIYETHRVGEGGEIEHTDPRLENLNVPPLLVGKGQRVDNRWLKFIFPDLILDESETYGARLTVIDAAGEEHSVEFPLRNE